MADKAEGLYTAGALAKELGATDGKVKKAIAELGLKPAMKKGVCNYYDKSALAKVKKALG